MNSFLPNGGLRVECSLSGQCLKERSTWVTSWYGIVSVLGKDNLTRPTFSTSPLVSMLLVIAAQKLVACWFRWTGTRRHEAEPTLLHEYDGSLGPAVCSNT